MCDYVVFDISKCQRRLLGFRYGPNGHQSVAWNSLNICCTSSTVEPVWKHITVARKTSNCCFHYSQTFFLLHGSMFCKYFLEIQTKEMLRKNSKFIVAHLEGAICFCFWSTAFREVTSSLLKGKRRPKLLFRDDHKSLNNWVFIKIWHISSGCYKGQSWKARMLL